MVTAVPRDGAQMLDTPLVPDRAARPAAAWFLARANLQVLIDVLYADGRTVIGPTVADGAVIYDEIRTLDQLPAGRGEETAPGRYRLTERSDDRLFGFTVGPTSWKRFTFPASVPLTRARRDGSTVAFEPAAPEPRALAFLGVRACDLAAIGVQDRVFTGGPFTDEDYRARRAAAFIIGVECTTSASTCFCTSMGTGPDIRTGADIVLTEVDGGFIVCEGSPAGREVIARLPLAVAAEPQVDEARAAVAAVAEAIGNPVATNGLHDRLLAQFDSPHWLETAEWCLQCSNCTLVCPTCFCTSVVQRSDLDGADTISERIWDSCFTPGFARVAGGNFRSRHRDRYRQWLTHKFATWIDQFGTSGCVGCGRCITWCPAGIDVRERLMTIAPPLKTLQVETPRRAAAAHPAEYVTGRIREVRPETADVRTLVIDLPDPAFATGLPGQFAMVDLPAFPALPISISRFRVDALELTIRAAGPATKALINLRPGDELGLRGPLGTSWPIDRAVGRDIVVVTGGIGLAPLRPLIAEVLANRDQFGAFRIYYGARTPDDLLFRDELASWAKRGDVEVALSVDRAGEDWTGPVGVVTTLFDRATWDGSRASAFICGPERMMTATAEALADRGVTDDRTFVTLERHMQCGIGLCGHCQMGKFFVCRDGPVFSLRKLNGIFGREGL